MAKNKEKEIDKMRGQTEAQKQNRAYHEGDFQTIDPVTGEERETPLPEAENFQFGAEDFDPETGEALDADKPAAAPRKRAAKKRSR